MAEGKVFTCNQCNKTIESWSDGNPYYLDQAGKKKYAYHPDHKKLSQCIGNDSPTICLSCATEFMNDSESPITHCPQCHSQNITSTFQLANKICPYCNKGHFLLDQNRAMLS